MALAAIAFSASTALAVQGELVAGEATVLGWANDLPVWVGAAATVPMHLGSSIGALAVIAAAVLARKRRVAAATFLGWLATRLASTALKALVDRSRPPDLVADVVLRQHLPADGGFPSSHSAIAAALAVVVAWGWPSLRLPLVALVGVVGVARMYVGVHLPLDLVGGWALGVLCGVAALRLAHSRVPPHPEPTTPWNRWRWRKVLRDVR